MIFQNFDDAVACKDKGGFVVRVEDEKGETIGYEPFNLDRLMETFPDAKEKYLKVKDNWRYWKQMNVCKANLLTTGYPTMPVNKSDINQLAVFNAQVAQFVVPSEKVTRLNSFPIFIYEYLK